MVSLSRGSKVYIVAPAAVATGGPELLHQLCYVLRMKLGIDARMFYIPNDLANPIHNEYRCYDCPFVRSIDDKQENLIIVPEILKTIKLLRNYRQVKKAIWWLSVDNFSYGVLLSRKKYLWHIKLINKLFRIFKISNELIDISIFAHKYAMVVDPYEIDKVRLADYHFVQSYYAMDYLLRHSLAKNRVFYLSDYLNDIFLEDKIDLDKKEDIVVYNPKKGFKFTRKLVEKLSGIKFVPIQGMTRTEVMSLLKRAKVYIDFGYHPGKDRIPREAAVLGCCVITSLMGSAKYYQDLPIPDRYKIDRYDIVKIGRLIQDCLLNYQIRIKDFDMYRKVILLEKNRFLSDVQRIFGVQKDSICQK